MKTIAPMRRRAVLIASNYEGTEFPKLRWACADVAALARLLVTCCGFERVIVFNERPRPRFTEGHVPRLAEFVERWREAFDRDEPLAMAVGRFMDDEGRALLFAFEAKSGRVDWIKGLMIRALNEYVMEPLTNGEGEAACEARRGAWDARFPELAAGPSPCPGVECRPGHDVAAIRDALLDLTKGQKWDVLVVGFCGHGFEDGAESYLVMPDATPTEEFPRLGSLRMRDLCPRSGLVAFFVDACRAARLGPASESGARGGGARDLVGWRMRTFDGPERGAVGILHTCWAGTVARESNVFRHGIGTRLLLEAIEGGAWQTVEQVPDGTGILPRQQLRFDAVAVQVHRELVRLGNTMTTSAADPSLRQDAFLHWAGVPVPIVLGERIGAGPDRDPRIWSAAPRLREIREGCEFRANGFGIPFVCVADLEVLMACWPVRVRDYAVFAGERGLPLPTGGGEEHPVTGVSPRLAFEFCDWWTERERRAGRLPPRGLQYGMPTDAEWSRAAGRVNGRSPFPGRRQETPVVPWGNRTKPAGFQYGAAGTLAVRSAAGLDAGEHPGRVGGLLGLAGNVWEILDEEFDREDFPGHYVIRGESYLSDPAKANLFARQALASDQAAPDTGFRLVLRRG